MSRYVVRRPALVPQPHPQPRPVPRRSCPPLVARRRRRCSRCSSSTASAAATSAWSSACSRRPAPARRRRAVLERRRCTRSAIALSAMLWLIVGAVAARRSTRNPMADVGRLLARRSPGWPAASGSAPASPLGDRQRIGPSADAPARPLARRRPHHTVTSARIVSSLAGPMPRTSSRSSTEANGPLRLAVVDDRLGRRRADARQRVELVGGRPVEVDRSGRRGRRRPPTGGGAGGGSPHDRHVDPLAVGDGGGEVERRRGRPRESAPPAASSAACTRAPAGSS